MSEWIWGFIGGLLIGLSIGFLFALCVEIYLGKEKEK